MPQRVEGSSRPFNLEEQTLWGWLRCYWPLCSLDKALRNIEVRLPDEISSLEGRDFRSVVLTATSLGLRGARDLPEQGRDELLSFACEVVDQIENIVIVGPKGPCLPKTRARVVFPIEIGSPPGVYENLQWLGAIKSLYSIAAATGDPMCMDYARKLVTAFPSMCGFEPAGKIFKPGE